MNAVQGQGMLRNHLTAALPRAELQRWLPLLQPVEMPLGAVLYEPRVTLSHVYFPATAIVSLLYVLENGASAEIAVGRNGTPMAAISEKWRRDQFQRQVSAAMKLLSTGSFADAEECCDPT